MKSRGQLVSAGRSSADLVLVPEVSWTPLACISVFCVHPSGEVVNDVIQLPVAQFLQNKVSHSSGLFSVYKMTKETAIRGGTVS